MSALTAKYRIAPGAIRKMLVPMPTGRFSSQGYILVVPVPPGGGNPCGRVF